MLSKDYINKIKKNKLDYLSLLLALVATYLIFKEQYLFSFILAISSIGLFQYNYYQDSKKIKEQLLKNQKEEIKKKLKNITLNPNKIGLVGDTLSKLIVVGLIIFFLIFQVGKYVEQHQEEIQKSINIISAAKTPPYILTENRTVNIVFLKTDASLGHWTVPFDSLDSSIKRGFYRREFMPELFIPMVNQMYGSYLPLCAFSDCSDFVENYKETMSELQENSLQYINLTRDDGSAHLVMDFRPFIDSETFTNVIRTLYQESESDGEFIREVWNIVTQLNTYSTEIEETPRYPLETFLAGGGDCEDSSILLASMIKSAPTNWDVQLVYMDADNPENPQEVNHVLVFVDTGKEKYFIETTNNQEMQPYGYIDGWYLEI